MSASPFLRIGDVVSRTGLSERRIRHYETLGLVTARRSRAGQRLYDADALLALAKIKFLRRAGLPLALIKKWLASPMDARALIAVQLDHLRSEHDRVTHAIAHLKTLDAELSAGADADVDHLARLIEAADDDAAAHKARAFFEARFHESDAEDWRAMTERLREDVDPHAYDDAWRELIARTKAGLPLDPASARAQALLDQWERLLEPFRRVASARQQEMAATMWGDIEQWGAQAGQPANQDVINFIRAAYAARAPQGQTHQGKDHE